MGKILTLVLLIILLLAGSFLLVNTTRKQMIVETQSMMAPAMPSYYSPPRSSVPELSLYRLMPSPPPPEPVINNADTILDQLSESTIAFSIVDKVNIKEKFQAQLLISLVASEDELVSQLTIEGENFSAGVLISQIVHAKLTAPSFDVQPITPERQAVSIVENTEWLWTLTPTTTGVHDIYLTITAFVYAGNTSLVERHIKTFQKKISVEVTPTQVVKSWIAEYWQWSLTTLILPFLYFLRKKKHQLPTD